MGGIPASIPDPMAAAFRTFADSTGADRLALSAHVRAVNTEPLPLGEITAPALVVAGEADPLAARPPEFTAALVGFLGDDSGS